MIEEHLGVNSPLPKGWSLQRIKTSVADARNGLWGEEPTGGPDDVWCIRVADFDRGSASVSGNTMTFRSITELERRSKEVLDGDLLLEKSGGGEKSPVGFVVQYRGDNPAVTSNFVSRLRTARGHDARFWLYVHSALYSQRITERSIKQTSGIQNLDQSSYFDEKVPVPRLGVQTQIAHFLDRETAQIDELISKQEQLIRLANERVQAEMDSLFGQFERTTPLRRIIATVESGTSVNAIDTPISHGEIGVLKTSSVSGGRFDFEENKTVVPEELNLVSCPVREGMVIVSRMNTPRLVGAAGYVEGNVENLYLPDRLWQLHIPSGAELFWLWTRTTHYRDAVRTRASGTSASMKNISQDHLMSIQYPQIPHELGIALVGNLREGIRKTDTLVSKATEMIALLKERRRALITAAVTGKIDVTGKV